MKKINVFQASLLKAGMVLSITVGFSGIAEDYSSYQSSFDKDIGKVESLLKTPNKSTGGSSEQSLSEIDAKLAAAAKNIEQSKEETDLRGKLGNWVKKNDSIDKSVGAIKALEQKALKDRDLTLKQAESLASSLRSGQSQVNRSDFNTNNLPNACRKGVDFSQTTASLDSLSSEPFKYLQTKASELLDEKIKENKAKLQQKILDVVTYFKELANKDVNAETALKSDSLKGEFALEKRVEELKAKNKAAKELNKEKRTDLVEFFAKFASSSSQIQDNDKRVGQLGNEFADQVDNTLKMINQTMLDNSDQLLANCRKEVKLVFQEIENTRQWLAPVVGVEAANLDAQAQIARANSLRCTDVSDQVQVAVSGVATGGVDIKSQLNSIRSEKNPTKLLANAVQTMQAVSNIQAQAGTTLRPLIDDCTDAANGREALKERAQPIMAQQKAGANSSASGSPRTNSRSSTGAGSRNWGANHSTATR